MFGLGFWAFKGLLASRGLDSGKGGGTRGSRPGQAKMHGKTLQPIEEDPGLYKGSEVGFQEPQP